MMGKMTISGGCILLLVLLSVQCQNPASTSNERKSVQPTTGGVVQDSRDEQDWFNLRLDSNVDGTYMKAYLVAVESFKAETVIPEAKKSIDNYKLELRQDRDFYFVLFLAKRQPSERNLRGGESALGVDVMYTIRKTNYDLISRKFFE